MSTGRGLQADQAKANAANSDLTAGVLINKDDVTTLICAISIRRVGLRIFLIRSTRLPKPFARLKAMLRKAGVRTVRGLWDLIGRLVGIIPASRGRQLLQIMRI